MMETLFVLAEDNAIFNLRNGILVGLIIVVLVAYKIYKNKTMT